MGDMLPIINFFVGNNKFGVLLSIANILIVIAIFVLLHEYKEQLFYYVFHRRNLGHFVFDILIGTRGQVP